MSNTEVKPQPSCESEFDPGSLSVDIAKKRIFETVTPVGDTEVVAVRDALQRVLSDDVFSPVDVPNHTNSAMDGYAVRGADLSTDTTVSLEMIGTAWAGKPFEGSVGLGQCVRIMTGAVMPGHADTVVMQEHTESEGDRILVAAGQRQGQHVRKAGEDLAAGGLALPGGRRCLPADLGLFASLGIGEVRVRRKPRVAFFSNGDELRSLGQSLSVGELYDSNRYTLYGMLKRAGVDLIDLGVVPDDRSMIRSTLESAAATSDMVITSAGASVGEADFIKEVLEDLGEVSFWKIAMKPGRPLAFGQIGKTLFFGLPGNPVSVMVTFYQFVLPALRQLAGEPESTPVRLAVRVENALKKRPGRTEYQRGFLSTGPDGVSVVRTTGDQGSGILSSMATANCFIILPPESVGVEAGSTVVVEPFSTTM